MEGIFRLNGSAKRIKDLQEIFDSPERYGKGLDWTGYTVHDAANVLRRYLNQLPEPIVPLEFYERFREPLRKFQSQSQGQEASQESEAAEHAKAVAAYQELIRELPPLNKQLLLYILDLLAVFASKSDQNRMNSANLSAIFQPGLLSHPQHDMSPDEYKLSQDVLIFLIENQDHFLVGMNGTAADEQTVKEVEAGNARPPTSQSNMRRSVSSASGGADSFKKYGSLRRNVSVSSKNSRASNNASNPATPTSLGAVGVHRSNTLPSKISPAARYSRTVETNPPGPAANQSRPASRTPPITGNGVQTPPAPANPQPSQATPGVSYVHSSTHGPTPKPPSDDPPRPQPVTLPPPTASIPPAVVTPTRERKLSNLFSRSPPPGGDSKDPRQPNRLKKKRIPGSASESAQSSSISLQGGTSDSALLPSQPPTRSNSSQDDGGATPRPSNSANPDDAEPQRVGRPEERSSQAEGGLPAADALHPRNSRTPSMNSRSSFTDYSDVDHGDEASRAERKDHRQSWRFHRSPKRSNEQVSLGLGSPPLSPSAAGADRSTSSVGHHSSKSSPSDLQHFPNDPSFQPLSLDAEVHNNGASKDITNPEPEKRSLFGKFKAKVAQVRDGVRESSERDRTRSPVHSDGQSGSSQNMPTPNKETTSPRPAPLDVQGEPKEAAAATPVSPLPSSGLPPAIPEEPHTPDSPVSPINITEKIDEQAVRQVADGNGEKTVEKPSAEEPSGVVQIETAPTEAPKEPAIDKKELGTSEPTPPAQ